MFVFSSFIYIFFHPAKCRVLIPLDLLGAAQFGEAVPAIGLISLISPSPKQPLITLYPDRVPLAEAAGN